MLSYRLDPDDLSSPLPPGEHEPRLVGSMSRKRLGAGIEGLPGARHDQEAFMDWVEFPHRTSNCCAERMPARPAAMNR